MNALSTDKFERVGFLASRGYIETPNTTDADLDSISEFKDEIPTIIKLYQLRDNLKKEYVHFDELLSMIPKEGFKSLEEHSVNVNRSQRELEIIFKTQILRKLLMSLMEIEKHDG